jgi:hypothetical protein
MKSQLAATRVAFSRFAGRANTAAHGWEETRAAVVTLLPVRTRQLFASPVVQAVAAAIAIAWLTWPVETLAPGLGRDSSWQAGLNMAARESLDFGKELIFAYGPLGFLAQPQLYYPMNAVLAALYVGVLQVVTAGSLLWAARASFGFLGAAVIALVIAKMAIALFPTTLLLPPLAFLWCAHAIRRRSSRWFLVIAAAGGVIAAFEFLVRLNVGIVVLAICGLTLLMERERRVRNLSVLLASTLISVLAFWLASGQDIRTLPDYALYSFEVVSGYSEAMGYEQIGLEGEYVTAAVVAAVVLLVGWRNTDGWGRHDRLKLLALGAVLAYPTFKQGFVRHDSYHSVVWFITAAVVVVALSWRRDRRAETMLGLISVLVAVLGSTGLTAERLNPVRSADAAFDQFRALVTSERLELAGEARAYMRKYYALDVWTRGLARGRTVHIHPDDASVAWAYPELRWHPLPAFQSYVTYTKRLDKLNATFLTADGPELVLRRPVAPLDGRHFALEAPETMLTMLCRYQVVYTSPAGQLLKRRANRCGSPRKIGSVRTRVGQRFAVPTGGGGGLILADLHELQTPVWQRLRSLIFRRENLSMTVNETSTFRLVPDTAKGRLIVRIPDGFDSEGTFALSLDATSLRIIEGEAGKTPGSKLTIDYYEVPIALGFKAPEGAPDARR